MNDYKIPIAIQSALGDRANAFNRQYLARAGYRYCPDARGKFIYLYRIEPDLSFQRLGRLTYEGDTEKMEFAIFNVRSGKYDPNDRSFPGLEYLDGTIEGALRALIVAYP